MPSKPLKAIKPMFQRDKWRIVRGDLVTIIAGKDRGQQGRVLRVIRNTRFPRVVVEGCNLVTRHVPQQPGKRPGMVVKMEAPLHYSNVMLTDTVTNKPVRTTYRYLQLEEGVVHKVRMPLGVYATKGKYIPRPDPKQFLEQPTGQAGAKDTPKDQVLRQTYQPGEDFSVTQLPRALREHVPYVPTGLRHYSSSSSSSSLRCALDSTLNCGLLSSSSGGGGSSSSSSGALLLQQQQQHNRTLPWRRSMLWHGFAALAL